MEQVTVVYKTFKFEELTPEVQTKVVDKYREQKSQYDSEFIFECVLDEWKEKLEGLGFLAPKIYFSGFSCQGDGACFEAECDLSEIVKHIPNKNDYRHLIPLIEDGQFNCKIEKNSFGHHYSHERTRYIDLDSPFWHERCPRAAALCKELMEELEEYRRDFSHQIYVALEQEWDGAMTDECIKEDISCNDLTFLEDGTIF